MILEYLDFMKLTFIVLFDPAYLPCTYTQECFVSAFAKDQWFDKEYKLKNQPKKPPKT